MVKHCPWHNYSPDVNFFTFNKLWLPVPLAAKIEILMTSGYSATTRLCI